MDRRDAVIVVTGAASGIGAALARRFADDQPRAVVLADIDAVACETVAASIRDLGPTRSDGQPVEVWSLGCDVADEDSVASLVAGVTDHNGPIDLFCANAGVGSAADITAPTEVWQRTWDINVMSQVHAARLLVPQWVERGQGHLLITASAAGLLTNLGDAPYSVTKHASVGLAEWIAITYGEAGVGVSCLCPMGVRTPLLFGDGDGHMATEVVKLQRVLEPEEVADFTAAALDRDEFLILPHAEVADYERSRTADRGGWLEGMRRLQSLLSGASE